MKNLKRVFAVCAALALFGIGTLNTQKANAGVLGFGTFKGTLVYDGIDDKPIYVDESCPFSLRRQC